jgi:hypothetical protein
MSDLIGSSCSNIIPNNNKGNVAEFEYKCAETQKCPKKKGRTTALPLLCFLKVKPVIWKP